MAALGPVLLVVALRATDAAPSWAATAGACEGDSGVTVVVDFGTLGGGIETRCAPEPVSSGFDALARAGFTYEGTARFPGLLCRIDGKPSAKQDACQNAPSPTYYWAYWTASSPGGPWTYSDLGAGNRDPAPGSVEGWAFSEGCKRQPGAPQACAGATTMSTAAPATTPTTRTTGGAGSDRGTGGTASGPGSAPGPDDSTTVPATSTSVAAPASTAEASPDEPTALAAAARPPAQDQGSPWGVLLGGAAVLALGATTLVRRRRCPVDHGGGGVGTVSAASSRLPRALHPGAWWLWALSLAVAASRTTNPIVLLLIVTVVGFVVSNRRSEAPWARGFRAYLVLGLVVVAIRVVFRLLLDGQYGQHVLFTLPEIPLPAAAAGIRIGGPVSAEGVLAALYDGLRLATLLLCVGAANVLADPKRLLKAMPAALHELGVAITVALSVAPQLVESGQRVRRARRLRGETTRRLHVVKEVAIPVMTDALDRSLLLAAAMDSRGYARSAHVVPGVRRTTGALLLGGLLGVCVGTYGLLDASAPRTLGYPMLAVGVGVAVVGLRLSGRRVVRTRYRQDPWRASEWVVALSGLVAAVVVLVVATVDPAALYPSFAVVRWPDLPLLPVLAVLLGAVPAWVAPPAVRSPRPSPIPTSRVADLAVGGAK